ncbi:MAG TPA: TlyA family rRNA (cytidine-2'-O)-methyltransferase, partial [Bdellovibrionales bacterium]|nr:TlyA family rRNA (cytidine-2'-O)-methyltransferase [Bdellovibrionales bacterium]
MNDEPVTKAGQLVDHSASIRIRGADHPYVSRGGIKLAAALDAFKIDVTGKTGLDIGASTGGFTQVLLLRGAQKIHAVDVGHSQLAWKIRQDSRVAVYEKTNARNMAYETIGCRVDIIVIDVSFISLEKVLPGLIQFATPETDWITLIKPQFEVGREKVGQGGLVRSEDDRQAVVTRITSFGETLGLLRQGLVESPITGTEGNKEFLAHWKRSGNRSSVA